MNAREKLLEYASLVIKTLRNPEDSIAREKMLSLEKELGLEKKEALKSALDEVLKDPNLQ
jgi:hypothetical protein